MNLFYVFVACMYAIDYERSTLSLVFPKKRGAVHVMGCDVGGASTLNSDLRLEKNE